MASQYFIQVASFADFARFVCAFRENPLRVYMHKLKGKQVFSSGINLADSVLSFYTPIPKDGRYILYDPKGGREHVDVVKSTKIVSNYAPIIRLKSLPYPQKTTMRDKDKLQPIEIEDLGSLARLTYDPEFPEAPNLTLYSFPHKKNWIIGYVTTIELEETVGCFNYLILDQAPTKPFLKYAGHSGTSPEFSDKFQHGYPYLPVIKLQESHPIFGLK